MNRRVVQSIHLSDALPLGNLFGVNHKKKPNNGGTADNERNNNMENTYIIKFYDLHEEQYKNGDHVSGFVEKETEEFGEGYTIEDYYSDRGVILETNECGDYFYETDDGERRYIVIA